MMTRRSGALTRGLVRKKAEKEPSAVPSRMVPLVPETVGLTSTPQPALLWYASDPWPGKMEFRVTAFKADEPLLDAHIQGPASKGMFRIDLADHEVRLEPDVEYEWFLTIVFDEEDRSADYFISGSLKYAEPSADVARRLANAPADRQYLVYAQAGYWYDAMDHLFQQIQANPGNTALRRHRAKLLEQVNLPKIAAYDTRRN